MSHHDHHNQPRGRNQYGITEEDMKGLRSRSTTPTEIPYKDGFHDKPRQAEHTPLKYAAVILGDRCFIGWRHADIMSHMRSIGLLKTVTQGQQGFVDADGFWWSRWHSRGIASRCRQLRNVPHTLTSEHLWGREGEPLEPEEERDE
jgi:hypothetical protein